MVPRQRSKARAGWPANLYTSGRGGFKYRHPVTKAETWMGTDKAKAFAAARKLNALLTPSDDLVARVVGTGRTVADALAVFRADDLPHRGWGAKTAAWYGVFLKRIEADIGGRELEGLTVKDCAEYIRGVTESARGRQTYRLVLGWILACAVQEGWIDSNPAELTRKFSHTRQRARLTLDTYRAIHAQAPGWLRNAMDLSLLTLLRREDVATLRFADVHDDALWVVPQKTEGSTAVRLRIKMGADLAALVARCRDAVVSPYLVHRLPEKAKPRGKGAAGRVHHTQVMPEQITRAFAEARDAAGIGGESPPTFHEIRSLGGALLREQGWSLQQVQALMGHASEAMTSVYLEGHEVPWSEVETGLSLRR
ncbi:integrase family protein [Pseudoxanthomonas suwonensis 11-1]|uniref:Integrase family protein n=1 Tax=Pseudoxanthomonas suwonensis (strain 11-1) TaxID=743721 RepID=E6WS25_PSEUU|nr:tyrosine-type recombinase/integrase [Pseudoxanthomonas suwonensis]ADV26974.1 integrase family protein [Pseudoxanthomonas suwonensis 11-1]